MTALSSIQRSALEKAVVKGRRLLEDDLAALLEGRFGIYPGGAVDDEEALRLSPRELVERGEVVGVLAHLRAEGASGVEAFQRLVREASFTHLNRLLAIRVAEAIDLLPPSLGAGKASSGFKEVLEVAPLLGADDTGGYWTYLRLCGDELAADAPVLFDPRNPLLQLQPRPAAIDELVGLLSDETLADVWPAPDTFGWSYQFFNTSAERSQMRESGAPRSTRELAVRNQFFTPRYVVDFLVHNSLGRRLLDADPDSPLKDELHMLVDPPTERGKPLELEEVRVLDPACGSGHFLLGCYDLLEQAWSARGVDPAEAAPRILPGLWGVDIDARCAQVASAALVLRARRHLRTGTLPRPNIITARGLPRDPAVWERILADLPSERRSLVQSLRDALEQAPLLGPLLKVEERLEAEISRTVGVGKAGDDLFTVMGVADDAFGRAEADVLGAIQRAADEASSSAAERLFAAEASDAIRFVETMRQRYDAVLMNPPFGEPIPETRDYLKSVYGWMPKRDVNLLAAFVGRGLELCREGGYVGAITSRAGMFLTTFETWRRKVLLGHSLVTLADLGHGVMEHALVEAAAYVIGTDHSEADRPATFIRLLKDTDRPAALSKAISDDRCGGRNKRVYRVGAADLDAIPGSPLAYWMAPSIRRLFVELPPLEGNGAEVRQGLATADDFRFVRAFWEVHPDHVARSRDETLEKRRWVPFAKGGEYSPYWADVHLVVDWAEDGAGIKQHVDRSYPYLKGKVEWVVKNTDYYFRPGLTWPRRTQGGFNPNVLPAGCVFADKGPGIFARDGDALTILAWLLSRPLLAMLDTVATFGAYEVGAVQHMPWTGRLLGREHEQRIKDRAAALAGVRSSWSSTDETSRVFVTPGFLAPTDESIEASARRRFERRCREAVAALDDVGEVEALLADVLELDEQAQRYLDEERGPLVSGLSRDALQEQEIKVLTDVYGDGPQTLEVETSAGSYLFDARIEGLCRALQRHPSVIVDSAHRVGLLPRGELQQSAADLVSYLVGIVFGRWDLRIGQDPGRAPAAPDLFEPVPIYPPGMLADDDEMPAREALAGYPLELPPDRLLLDEPGHPWDIEECVRRVAAELFDDPDAILAEAIEILGKRSLRDYFRRQFFKGHLSRYSKSRRKAPIYWQLSTPSRKWGIWLYAPVLSRETLYAIASQVTRREAAGQELIRSLRSEREAGGRGRSVRQVDERLAEEEALVSELTGFRAEAERIAGLGWEPDLDDGILLCAAPLASMFPAWPEAAKERSKLKDGNYEWATVARWKDAL